MQAIEGVGLLVIDEVAPSDGERMRAEILLDGT